MQQHFKNSLKIQICIYSFVMRCANKKEAAIAASFAFSRQKSIAILISGPSVQASDKAYIFHWETRCQGEYTTYYQWTNEWHFLSFFRGTIYELSSATHGLFWRLLLHTYNSRRYTPKSVKAIYRLYSIIYSPLCQLSIPIMCL